MSKSTCPEVSSVISSGFLDSADGDGLSSRPGKMADVALGLLKDIAKTAVELKKVLDTFHENEEECRNVLVVLSALEYIMSQLEMMELTNHPAICAATLLDFHGDLHHTLNLVTKWQKRNRMYRFFTAGDMARQLRRVHNNIQCKMQLWNLAISTSLMEVTIELTRTTTVRYDGPHPLFTQPQQDAAEMEINGSHSTTDGARPVEDVEEIITMVTTGTEASSAPSSSVTEFSLSETVATHHFSEESINGGSGYTAVSKQKIVIKMRMTCDKSRSKAMALVAKVAGVDSVGISGDGKDRVEVVGSGVDSIMLISALRKKVAPAELLQVELIKQKDEYKRPTVVNATEEAPQQEPATRWPRARSSVIWAIAAKLPRFMRPRPGSGTCQAAPSSSPLLTEHTDTQALAPTTGNDLPGESSSSTTFSAASRPVLAERRLHQYQEHARTSAGQANDGHLFVEKPGLLPPQHQPTATAPVRRRRRTFNMSMVHRRRRRRRTFNMSMVHRRASLPAARQSRMMAPAPTVEASPFKRSGARVLQLLVPCALCALVLLLASVWAPR